jgi:nucleotide-binding universal stress UspA family protein
MKNVLLLVHDDVGQEARFQAALDVARALGGHLTCLDVVVPPAIDGEPYSDVARMLLLDDARAREVDNRRRLQARLAHEDVPWNWLDATGTLAGALKDAAVSADLIVVNRRLDSFPAPNMRTLAAEMIVDSNRAVLAVPEKSRGVPLASPALIAWNGSREAMDALHLAMPLLQRIGSAEILAVDDKGSGLAAEEAAAYLSRYDVGATIVRRSAEGASIADTIQAEARKRGSSLVVMGGFGHRRLVEALTGGVSREMLSESDVPMIVAH